MDIDTPNAAQLPPRGRPVDDVASKARHRLWGWLVYCGSGMSWDALDAFWRPQIDEGTPTDQVGKPASRTRMFHRIFRCGCSPAVKGLNSRTLIEVVSASDDPIHTDATQLYESELWTLLGPKEPTQAWVHSTHQSLMAKLGLAQATGLECTVARHVGFDHPFVQTNNRQVLERCATRIARFASCDAIALLGCAFSIAMNRMALQEAHTYLWATIDAAKAFENRWNVNSGIYNLILWRLVHHDRRNLSPRYVGIRQRQRGQNSEESRVRANRETLERFYTLIPSHDLMSKPPMMTHDELPWDFFDEFPKHRKNYAEMDAQSMGDTPDFTAAEYRTHLLHHLEAESRDHDELKRDLIRQSRRNLGAADD